MSRKSFGLLAGEGKLPSVVAEALQKKNERVLAAMLSPEISDRLRDSLDDYRVFRPEKFGEIPEYFSDKNVERLVMAGSVDRSMLYEDDRLDNAGDTVEEKLSENSTNRDEDLIQLAVEVLESQGINVVGIDEILSDKLTPSGHLAGPNPHKTELNTLNEIIEVAKFMTDREIGQTVLGKRGSIVAVEAAEGTNRTIRRAGELAGEGLVMAKIARTNQDFRLDVPVVGASTFRELKDVNASLLAVEANQMLWLQRETCKSIASAHNISFLGWNRNNDLRDFMSD